MNARYHFQSQVTSVDQSTLCGHWVLFTDVRSLSQSLSTVYWYMIPFMYTGWPSARSGQSCSRGQSHSEALKGHSRSERPAMHEGQSLNSWRPAVMKRPVTQPFVHSQQQSCSKLNWPTCKTSLSLLKCLQCSVLQLNMKIVRFTQCQSVIRQLHCESINWYSIVPFPLMWLKLSSFSMPSCLNCVRWFLCTFSDKWVKMSSHDEKTMRWKRLWAIEQRIRSCSGQVSNLSITWDQSRVTSITWRTNNHDCQDVWHSVITHDDCIWEAQDKWDDRKSTWLTILSHHWSSQTVCTSYL